MVLSALRSRRRACDAVTKCVAASAQRAAAPPAAAHDQQPQQPAIFWPCVKRSSAQQPASCGPDSLARSQAARLTLLHPSTQADLNASARSIHLFMRDTAASQLTQLGSHHHYGPAPFRSAHSQSHASQQQQHSSNQGPPGGDPRHVHTPPPYPYGKHSHHIKSTDQLAAPHTMDSHQQPPPPPQQQQQQQQRASSPFAHLTDMRHPSTWFPGARAMQRRIIAHLGPTNSGKTHAALESLKAAQGGGVYCGPLRLLACEISERLLNSGIACKLVTGQEMREVEGAKHVAATVEMAPLMPPSSTNRGVNAFEVGVLDEVQMMADPGRGWGWTRVLLGMQAQTLHVCGDPGALPLLKKLVDECGDILEVHQYTRLAPLVVCGEPLGSLSSLQPGDCLVAFSRKKVHALQREVGRRSTHRAAMVYGALPPGARSQQAARFNQQQYQLQQQEQQRQNQEAGAEGRQGSWAEELGMAEVQVVDEYGEGDEEGSEDEEDEDAIGNEGCHVLVASDAIGMGLNLSIRRVIFTTLHKFDGKEKRQLTASEVRQIAGRAGRYKAIIAPPAAPPASSSPSSSSAAAAAAASDSASDAADSTLSDYSTQADALVQQQQQQQGVSNSGYVTVLDGRDLWALHAALSEPHAELKQACLMPRLEDLALYYAAINAAEVQANDGEGVRLDAALLRYMNEARLSPHYFCVNMAPMVAIASLLSCYSPPHGGLSISELLTFCTAPADVSNKAVASALLRFTTLYLEDGVVPLSAAASRTLSSSASLALSGMGPFHESSGLSGSEKAGVWDGERLSCWASSAHSASLYGYDGSRRSGYERGGESLSGGGGRGRRLEGGKREQRRALERAEQERQQQRSKLHSSAEVELRSLEEQHNVLDLYVWLAYRMPHAFIDIEAAIEARTQLGAEIERTLDTLAYTRYAAFEGGDKGGGDAGVLSRQHGKERVRSEDGGWDARQQRHGVGGSEGGWSGVEDEVLVACEKERDRLELEDSQKRAKKRQGRWRKEGVGSDGDVLVRKGRGRKITGAGFW